MGKSKILTEPETTGQQGNLHHFRQQQRKRSALEPVRPGGYQDVNNLPTLELLGQIWMRIRRSWVAFRFQADRITMGFFRKRVILKLGVITCAAYLLFFSDRELVLFSGESTSGLEGRSIFTENAIDGDAGSRSILIPEEEEYAEKPVKKAKTAASGKSAAVKTAAAPIKGDIGNADAQTRRYIERFHNIAIAEMHRYGVPASISLAQGLIESRAGSSKLAVRNNNHFGIKCFARNCGKGHCSNHTDDSHKDFFRIYKTAWESWRAHSHMISSGRYAKLKKYGRDYRKWAYGLKRAGYATDRTYADKLIGMIERYNLQQFDKY